MLACWLAAPCLGQRRLLEDGASCSQRYQRCNHLGLQILIGLTITHLDTRSAILYAVKLSYLYFFFLREKFNIKLGASH